MNKKSLLVKDAIIFFLITEFFTFFILLLVIYQIMGVIFSLFITESLSPLIISIIVFSSVSYFSYLFLKPITLIEKGINKPDDTIILKRGNRLGLFFILVNIIGYIFAPFIGVIIRVILDGFLRWATIRFFIICMLTGIIVGLFQYIYILYKIRNLKIKFIIIEFKT